MGTSLVSRLKTQGRWTEPPVGVPESQWADAIERGITDRYKTLKSIKVTYEQAYTDLYGPD